MAIPFKSPTPRHQDVMVLYSDGVTEAENEQGNPLNESGRARAGASDRQGRASRRRRPRRRDLQECGASRREHQAR